MRVKLGKQYKDSICGFQGVAVARTEYLHGCVRILIAPTALKPDGDFLPDCWFDEPQLESVRSTLKIRKTKAAGRHPGGPSRSVPSNRDPV